MMQARSRFLEMRSDVASDKRVLTKGEDMDSAAAPLEGIKVLEFTALGPAPQAAWQLGGLGASLTVVDPVGRSAGPERQAPNTVRRFELDLKDQVDLERAKVLVAEADVLIEGFRPGVMERLGLGPEQCHCLNPGLVYGRMTGWGQDGPLAQRAGHDINYIGLTGVLRAIADRDGHPVPPLNIVGDSGGGTMFLIVGILSALLNRARTGRGCVIDAAILDGTFQLSNMIWQFRARDTWEDRPRRNQLDGGAPYYDVYRCADGEFMAVGALEPKFYREFLDVLGLDAESVPDRMDRSAWPALRELLATTIASRTRDDWSRLADGRDACFTPVLNFEECLSHPQVVARGLVNERTGYPLPAPAPRFEEASVSRDPVPGVSFPR